MKSTLLALGICAALATAACDRKVNQDTGDASASATTSAQQEQLPENPTQTSADAAPDSMRPTDDGAPAADGSMSNGSAVPANPDPSDTPSVDNGEALGLLAAVNEHEIQAADQALSKKVSGPVAEYAQMMKKEHTANQTKTRALGAKEDSREVQGKKDQGKAELAELGKKTGDAYEKAYVDAMVKGHTDALGLIDGPLMQMSSAGPVRDHLTETRTHVAMHLEAAQKLQSR